MTIAELIRFADSKQRVMKQQAQEKATYDYILADLIGQSISRLYSSTAKLPDISEVYPTLFDIQQVEEKKQKQRDELSALRFKQFAKSFNENYKQEVCEKANG